MWRIAGRSDLTTCAVPAPPRMLERAVFRCRGRARGVHKRGRQRNCGALGPAAPIETCRARAWKPIPFVLLVRRQRSPSRIAGDHLPRSQLVGRFRVDADALVLHKHLRTMHCQRRRNASELS